MTLLLISGSTRDQSTTTAGATVVDLPRIPVPREAITDGEITDPALRTTLTAAAGTLLPA